MRTILLQPEVSGAEQAVIELSPGREVTFGRGTAGVPVDFPIDHPGISRQAGIAAPSRPGSPGTLDSSGIRTHR